MNLRPSGYEPDELPDCSIPRYPIFVLDFSSKADDRTRTDNLLITNQLLCQLSHIGRLPDWQVGGGGFEPPKQFAADLQSVPFGHSGICPFIRYTKCALTRKDYSIVTSFMQAFFINVLVSCSVIHQNNSRIFLHAYFKHSIHYFILFRHQGITCLI